MVLHAGTPAPLSVPAGAAALESPEADDLPSLKYNHRSFTAL